MIWKPLPGPSVIESDACKSQCVSKLNGSDIESPFLTVSDVNFYFPGLLLVQLGQLSQTKNMDALQITNAEYSCYASNWMLSSDQTLFHHNPCTDQSQAKASVSLACPMRVGQIPMLLLLPISSQNSCQIVNFTALRKPRLEKRAISGTTGHR